MTHRRVLLVVLGKAHREHAFLEELRGGGCEVHLAIDRATALRLSAGRRYDAVLVDENVNGELGADLFREIARRLRHVKGILCSGHPTLNTIDAAVQAGVTHVVSKPLDPAEVLSILEGVVEESSRPFDRRFPHAPLGFAAEADMAQGEDSSWCETCNRPTRWFHTRLRRYFCCQDCLVRYQSLHDFSACSANS